MKSTQQSFLATILSRLTIGLAVAVTPAVLPARAAEGDRLIGEEIGDALRGMTLEGVYNDGQASSYRETYNPDGTVAYHDDDNGDQKGVWGVSRNTFCTYYEGIAGTCFQVTVMGTNCFLFTAVNVADRPPLPNDWTAKGWKAGIPPTCGN